jgi:hypothetical protein
VSFSGKITLHCFLLYTHLQCRVEWSNFKLCFLKRLVPKEEMQNITEFGVGLISGWAVKIANFSEKSTNFCLKSGKTICLVVVNYNILFYFISFAHVNQSELRLRLTFS